jgi:manganese efflux pump family protein
VLKLLAFVLPLGLDSFAVAAAIGATQVTTVWQRLRISLVFVIFEGGMPLTAWAWAPPWPAASARSPTTWRAPP